MVRKRVGIFIVVLLLIQAPIAQAENYSDTARFVQGFTKVVAAPFYTPWEVVKGTFSQFPPVGVVKGAFVGTYRTVTTLASGFFDMAGAAAPYVKYAFPFFL